MTLSIVHTGLTFYTSQNWVDIVAAVHDIDPDQSIELQAYSQGLQLNARILLSDGQGVRLSRKMLTPFVTFIGQKRDEQKAYIALNFDLNSAVVFNLYAVDESGGSGGGSTPGDEYRVAGSVQINGTAAQRDLVVISDDAGSRAIIGEGQSETDGTFDLTYTGWDGAVIVVALDEYGIAFPASSPLNLGTVVHPTTPNGYVYVVTEAGTTGATEPTWATSGTVVSSSVTFAPQAYYRPVASGPLQGELV